MQPALVERLRARSAEMVEVLGMLVEAESPSNDRPALDACAAVLSDAGKALLGATPDELPTEGGRHLRWRFGNRTRVLLVGHYDTVWPLGTLERWPFRVDGDVATGPGTFDMKAGIVQGLFGLSELDDLDGVTVLVTADEELGSPTSRALVEDSARGADAALVLEPSAAGALKTGRKGVSIYRLSVVGRAAHAGLEPGRGANALVELAHQVLGLAGVEAPRLGTTVTPTVAVAGSATNVVPASASVNIDVRALEPDEQVRVDAALRALVPVTEGVRLEVSGGPNRPPLPTAAAEGLFARACAVGEALGLPPLQAVTVGGASDGNYTAGVGTPTLDGLGPIGDGAHAEGEHVLVSALPDRAALVAGLVADLLGTALS